MHESLMPHAELVEHRANRQGHVLGNWHRAEIVVEVVPAELADRGIQPRSINWRICCRNCSAWAAFISLDGISCNASEWDEPCIGKPESAA